MHLTASQCRGARAMLDWTQIELAERSGVDVNTIRNFENGKHTPQEANQVSIREALESGGVEFIERGNGGPGARLRG